MCERLWFVMTLCMYADWYRDSCYRIVMYYRSRMLFPDTVLNTGSYRFGSTVSQTLWCCGSMRGCSPTTGVPCRHGVSWMGTVLSAQMHEVVQPDARPRHV